MNETLKENAYFIYIPTLSKGPFVKLKQPIECCL